MVIDKKILSIDSDDDEDGVDIKSFTKFVEDDTKRNKNVLANQFTELGEDLLAEIEAKKLKQEIQKNTHILYILKHDNRVYSEKTLKSYSYEDVLNIYNELKTRGTFLQKAFRFIFNL